MAEELETWADFVNSEGFRLFAERAQREWGPSGLRFQQAVREAADEKDGSSERLRIVLAVQRELLALMAWPNERLESLRNQRKVGLAMTVSMSRRGPGL